MKNNFIYIIKKVIIVFFITVILFSIKSCHVNAAAVIISDNVVLSGDSLKDIAQIGTYKVGKGYYEETTADVFVEKYIKLDFLTNLPSGLDENNGADNYVTRYTLDVCVNGSIPNIALWSSYNNFIDLVVPTDTVVYAVNEEWARLNCYRAFIRLNTSYLPITIPDYSFKYMEIFSNNVIKVGVSANYGYNLLVKFNDMVYYSAGEYDRVLNDAKNQNRQFLIEQGVNNLNDNINNGSVDNPNSGINTVKNGIASNGVITQLITLPVTLFQQILTSINGTCQTFNLGSLFGTDLLLPCINVSNYLGSTLWGIIDVIISGYFVWVIARKMISAFEMFSAMKDGDVLDD